MPLTVHSLVESQLFDSPISFALEPTKERERVFIVANSGAGATTLLKIVSGLQNPQDQKV